MDWSNDRRKRGEAQRQMELLTGALHNYMALHYNTKKLATKRPDHLLQLLLSTKGYRSSVIIGSFPLKYVSFLGVIKNYIDFLMVSILAASFLQNRINTLGSSSGALKIILHVMQVYLLYYDFSLYS